MTLLRNSAAGLAVCAVAVASAMAQEPAGNDATAAPPGAAEQFLSPGSGPFEVGPGQGPRSLLPPRPLDGMAPTDPGQVGPQVVYPGGAAPLPGPAEGRDSSLAARPGEAGTGIEIAPLSGLAGEGVGLVGPETGGFAPSLWSGSRRLVIEDGLALLRAPVPSPAAASLYRRLLISRAPLPQGTSGGTPVLTLRLDALYAGGFAPEALALAQRLPAGEIDASMAVAAARAALATGAPDSACSYLDRLPASGEGPQARFALELGTLCQVRAGLDRAALLSVDLAREDGTSDAIFLALASAAAGGPQLPVPAEGTFTSLHLALAREAGTDLPETVVERAEPALLPVLADEAALSWPQRLEAGERAAQRGLIDGAALAELYRRAVVEAAADANPRARGFAAALDAPDAASRLAAIAEAFAQTPAALWPGVLPAFAGALRAVPAAMDHAGHAVFMAEALALLGDPVRADAWIGIVTAAAPAQTARLEALLRIAAPPVPGAPVFDAQTAARAAEVRRAAGDEEVAWLTAVEMQALASLGEPIPQMLWAGIDDAQLPGLPLSEDSLRALRLAAEARRTGEAVLASLNALAAPEVPAQPGPVVPAALSPQSLAAIITALARAGLMPDARALAAEALVVRANGGGR